MSFNFPITCIIGISGIYILIKTLLFSKEGVDITTELGTTHNYWSSFVSRGEIDHHIYLMRKDRNSILIDKNDNRSIAMALGIFVALSQVLGWAS